MRTVKYEKEPRDHSEMKRERKDNKQQTRKATPIKENANAGLAHVE